MLVILAMRATAGFGFIGNAAVRVTHAAAVASRIL